MKKNILIVFGGNSPEHDVSCHSAASIYDYIDREKYNPYFIGITRNGEWFLTEAKSAEIDNNSWESLSNKKAYLTGDASLQGILVENEIIHIDCIFSIIHGNQGEDGKLQGLFELADIPYVGGGVCSSAISMDKAVTRLFADNIGLKQPNCVILTKEEYENNKQGVIEKLKCELGYPMFSKPASTGSSIGISKIIDEITLINGLDLAFKYENKILIEQGISGDEIKVAVLGNDEVQVGDLCKMPMMKDGFNDYETKYITKASTKEIPANLDSEIADEIKRQAKAIYKELQCKGFSRVDFFLTENNEIYFNEINTVPGFSNKSIYPLMFEKYISYKDIITKLIELAEEEYYLKNSK